MSDSDLSSDVGEAKELFAFVGRDREDGIVGLKQGYTAVGLTPLVATRREKIDRDWLRQQMQHIHADARDETVLLVRYEAVEVLARIEREQP